MNAPAHLDYSAAPSPAAVSLFDGDTLGVADYRLRVSTSPVLCSACGNTVEGEHDLFRTPEGRPITQAEFDAAKHEWIPSEEDQRFVKSLMQRVTEPGKIAGWIAPPDRGINAQPVEYEYVRL